MLAWLQFQVMWAGGRAWAFQRAAVGFPPTLGAQDFTHRVLVPLPAPALRDSDAAGLGGAWEFAFSTNSLWP